MIYKSKNGSDTEEFDSLDFIACLSSHIPNKNEQMVRYLGFYSNVCRGKRKKQGSAESEYVIEDDSYNKGCSKSWARLIKKIIAFIEDYKVIKKILDWLGIYERILMNRKINIQEREK